MLFVPSVVVGGLLSAHLLSKKAGVEVEAGWPCSGPLLRMAEAAARKLLPGKTHVKTDQRGSPEVLLLLLEKRVAELLYQTLGISTFQLPPWKSGESWAFGGLD